MERKNVVEEDERVTGAIKIEGHTTTMMVIDPKETPRALPVIVFKDGELILLETNLSKILNATLSQAPENNEIPNAFMAVLGQPKSGKSFFTNLILHCLASKSCGGWMQTLVEERKFLRGFHFGTVPSSDVLIKNTSKYSGIWLWPTPYIISNGNGERIVSWVLHYQSPSAEIPEDGSDLLELVLALICSRILEINNDRVEFRVGKLRRKLTLLGAPNWTICDSVSISLHSDKLITRKVHYGKENMLELLAASEGHTEQYLLNGFSHLSFTNMQHLKNLHDVDGLLNQEAMKSQYVLFKNTVNTFLEEDEIKPKKTENGHSLMMADIEVFLASCVNYVNQSSGYFTGESVEEEIDPREARETKDTDAFTRHNLFSENTTLFSDETENKVGESIKTQDEMEDELGVNDVTEEFANLKLSNSPIQREIPEASLGEVWNLNENSEQTNREKAYVFADSELKHEKLSTGPLSSTELNLSPSAILSSSVTFSLTNTEENNVSANPLHQLSCNPCNNHSHKIEESALFHTNAKDEPPAAIETEVIETYGTKTNNVEPIFQPKQNTNEETQGVLSSAEKNEDDKSKTVVSTDFESDFRDLVNEAASLIRQTLSSCISNWIMYSMTPENIEEFGCIYRLCYQDVLESNYTHVIPSHLWGHFRKNVHRLNKDLVVKLPPAFQPASQLNVELKRQFDLFGYFPPDKFNKILSTIKVSSTELYDNETLKYKQLSLDKIRSIYTEMNYAILTHETEIMQHMTETMKYFYNEEMKSYLKEHGAFTHSNLRKIHRDLVFLITDAAKSSINITSCEMISEAVVDFIKHLDTELNKAFHGHQISNEMKLKKLQLETKRLVSQGYNAYVQKIEEIIQKHPEGYDQTLMEMEHKVICNEQESLLKIKIRNKIRKLEPTEGHCEALIYQINQYWSAVKRVNLQNIEKQKALIKALKNNTVQSKVVTGAELKEVQKDSGTLIMKFSYGYITVGAKVKGEFQVFKSSYGEDKIPMIVGINGKGDLVYGTDAVTQCYLQTPPFQHWWITDIWGTQNSTYFRKTTTFNVGDGKYSFEFSVEFLLGFLLRSIKQETEAIFHANFDCAVITVPFWSCSTHRVQIKDAASVAGFGNVYLANEESAAAFECANRQKTPLNNILVLSQNHGIVGAFMYSYSRSMNLIMDAYEVQNTRLTASNKPFEILDFLRFFGNKTKGMDMESKTALVRQLCDTLFYKCLDSVYHDVVFLSDSEKDDEVQWLEAFQFVIKSWKWQHGVSNTSHLAGIYGLSLILCPSNIGFHIQDAVMHDIRKCYTTGIAKEFVIAISCEYFKSREAKPVSFRIKLPTNEVCFYQRNLLDSKGIIVGKVDVKSVTDFNNKKFYIVLKVDPDGIVSMTSVKCKSDARDEYAIVEKEFFEWITPNKNKNEKELISKLLLDLVRIEEKSEKVRPQDVQESNEIAQLKAVANEICNDMERGKIEERFNFKTEISSTLFQRKIDKVRKFLNEPGISVANIEKEIEMLEKTRLKYSK